MSDAPETADPTPAGEPAAAASPAAPPWGGTLLRVALVLLGVVALAALAWTWSPAPTPPATSPPGAPSAPGAAPGAAPETKRTPMVVTVIPAVDDRMVSEPCNRIPGGGLFSARAAIDMGKRTVEASLGICMGDISTTPGPVGRTTTEFHYHEVLPETGIDVVAVGEGELQHGSVFARQVLARTPHAQVLCANALDPTGLEVLRAYQLVAVGGRNVLVVAVAGRSVGLKIERLGSDIAISDPVAAAAAALAAGNAKAAEVEAPPATRILLVHGTVDEADEVVRGAPGFDFAFAADGGVLPEREERVVDGVPVRYAGRGARFVWRVVLASEDARVHAVLLRLGPSVTSAGSPYASRLGGFRRFLGDIVLPTLAEEGTRPRDPRGSYAGPSTCTPCHAAEAARHARSRHARPSESLRRSEQLASPGCTRCHVTAAAYDGGWTTRPEDADLVGVTCESCHGPGREHAESPAPGYGAVDYATCYGCHLPDRTPGFDAAAAWAAHGHGPEHDPEPTTPPKDGD